jgi:hypothetical protein
MIRGSCSRADQGRHGSSELVQKTISTRLCLNAGVNSEVIERGEGGSVGTYRCDGRVRPAQEAAELYRKPMRAAQE